MISLGAIQFDGESVLRQLERDLIDDWFQDPRKFEDMFEQGTILSNIANNYEKNGRAYQASKRKVLNLPKSNFTLRCALETSITDRAIYHCLTSFLIPFFDPLIPWQVFSHRYNSDYKSEKYIFKRGVPAWRDFVGSVKAATTGNPVNRPGNRGGWLV